MNIKGLSALTLAIFTAAAGIYVSAQKPELFTVAQRPVQNADFTTAAESTINGVVSIKSFASVRRPSGYGNGFNDPFFDFFFGDPFGGSNQRQVDPRRQRSNGDNDESQQQEKGLGSGVIISKDGYIITNNHVIDGAERLEVLLNDNRVFNATVIGTDPQTDLALIKIDASDLPVIPWGDSDDLKIGEWVLAVGNPFGLTSTVTAGIVSAKARRISNPQSSGKMGIESYIQTDAAVNPGNSGGALVNLNGELVGINSAIYSQTGSYSGYSFAIPTSIVRKIADDLMKFRTVQRAVLGISFTELTAKVAQEKGITKVTDGLIVGSVTDRSAAMEAGIKPGDVIIAINGTPTHNTSQLMEQLNRFRPGEQISITYIRDNKESTVKTTLYNSAGNTKISSASSLADMGCAFKALKDETRRQLKISGGVQVAGLKDGPAKDAGIRDGFIVLEVNGARISSVEDMERAYDAVTGPASIDNVMFITGIYPTGKKAYYAVNREP